MLWVVFAVLTGLAVMSVLLPLARRSNTRSWRESEADFYRAQVNEIAQDVTRGLLTEKEAQSLKAETARRFIADTDRSLETGAEPQAGASDIPASRPSPWRVRIVSLIALAVIPAVALGLYLMIGHPGEPDAPLQARLDKPQQTDMSALVAKIESHLKQNPEDSRGWQVLAPVYMRFGRFDEAANAYSQVLRLTGENPAIRAAYGEALVMMAKGIVTPEAQDSFRAAPDQPRSQFYLGIAAEQAGDKENARRLWTKLLADSPADAAFVPLLRQRLAALGDTESGAGASAPPPAPVPATPAMPQGAAAIAAMPEAQRNAVIHTMVDRLAARLAENGQDLEGWLRLIRAYNVLQEEAKAKGALANARRAMTGNAEALARIDALADELGLKG